MKSSFLKPNQKTWDLHLKPICFGKALNAFWKRALYICVWTKALGHLPQPHPKMKPQHRTNRKKKHCFLTGLVLEHRMG